jgi:helitron helicase-like protein/uncharacterized protein DUF6570/PIF1-like helicase
MERSPTPVIRQTPRPEAPAVLRSLAPSPVPLDGGRLEVPPSTPSPVPRKRSRTEPPEPPAAQSTDTQLGAFIHSLPPQTLGTASDLKQPALSQREWALLKSFHKKLREAQLETCVRCRERWFHQRINSDGVCRCCVKVDKNQDVFLFGPQNNMQPDPAPDLPELTQVEEMLISRTHVFLEVRLVRGQQYRYRGHIVHFLRDVGRVYDQLPLLPADVDMIVLRPSNTNEVPAFHRQFRRDYRVRRCAIIRWLDFLRGNHPGYRDVQISAAAIEELPEDGPVDHLLPSQVVDAELPSEEQDPTDQQDDPAGLFNDDSDEPECAAVPDVLATEDEVTAIRNMVDPVAANPHTLRPHIIVPSFRQTPISEFNNSAQLLSMAFPTLFPKGSAEYVLPRERKVEYAEYVRHLIKHESGRFARHPRFRYVVFNTIMRRQVSNTAGFFVKSRPGQPNPTADELREAFQNNDPEAASLLRSITSMSGSLRGTRSYWGGRRQDLQSHIQHLGAAHFFLTLSAADLHWDDLMRHLPRYNEWRDEDISQRIRIARDNLRDNPHIVSFWFHHRFKTFKEVVLDRKFKIRDYWFRYEWQGRGSTHVHGVYWVQLAPDSEQLDSAQLRDAFARFWGIHIIAINPEPSRQPPTHTERPVMQYSPEEQQNTLEQLSALVNRVQRHVCSDCYCRRMNRVTKQIECRFHFPMKIRMDPVLDKPIGSTFYRMYPPRNHEFLNAYNPLVSMAWQANIDIAPCTGRKALLEYLTKYVSKPEPGTQSYRQMMESLLTRVNPDHPLRSAVNKLLNRLIGERDWAAQEVFHMLLKLPLQQSSRQVVRVNCYPDSQQGAAFHVDHEEENESGRIRRGQSSREKYTLRPPYVEDVPYIRWLRAYNPKTHKPRRAKDCVLIYGPVYKQTKQAEDFARVKMMLHHPFRKTEDLLMRPNGTTFDSFTEAFEHCKRAHPPHETDNYDDDPVEDLPEELFEDIDIDEEEPVGSWEVLAAQRPGHDGATYIEDADTLGQRDIDREYDWRQHVGRYADNSFPSDYWKLQKAHFPTELLNTSTAGPSSLNDKQWQLYNLIVSHYLQWLRSQGYRLTPPSRIEPPPRLPAQLLINLDGKAGTGKSHVIGVLSAALQDLADQAGIATSPILRAAPTGVAAHGIAGRTLHSLFHLPVPLKAQYEPLPSPKLKDTQELFRGVRYVIIDEKSMIGLRALQWIDRRCHQIFPSGRDQPFGGLNIIIAGDFFQLPPVMQKPLYTVDDCELSLEDRFTCSLYTKFNITVELDTVVRQQGQDTESCAFRTALAHLRVDQVSRNDWQLLASRVAATLPPAEVLQFVDALHIFPTKAGVAAHNHQRLRDIRNPVVRIAAVNSSQAASRASTEDASNLANELLISIGSRVMLLDNTWTERGLVNGSFATIRDIVWPYATTDPRSCLPQALLVEFDKYTGPIWQQDEYGRQLVPVLPVCREFAIDGENHHRTQFPITLAYSITVHRAQGISVDRAVLDISNSEFTTGLRYVAVSRVRTLKGVLFHNSFDFDDLRQPNVSPNMKARLADQDRRREQHVRI